MKPLCFLWAEVLYSIGCGIVDALLKTPDWDMYVNFEGHLAIHQLLKNEYVAVVKPLVDHFDRLILGENVRMCHSSVDSIFKRLRTKPSDFMEFTDFHKFDCSNPLSRQDVTDITSVVLPIAAPNGMKCMDLMSMDYTSDDVFRHHRDSILVDGKDVENVPDKGEDRKTISLVIILVISSSLFLVTIALVGVIQYVRARAARRRGGPAQVEKISQHILTDCKRSDMLLGKGGEAEVYFGEISVNGVVRQVASKMYFRPDHAKAELSFCEALPYHENILSVFGCHIDNETRRWCLAMEYCRHGSMRECMNAGSFPRSAKLAHHTIMKLMGALSTLHQNKMAHRDIKLDNILLSCSCKASAKCDCLRVNHGKLCAKLADFGMSKRGVMMGLSSANVRGTMMYIPPERVNYDIRKHHAGFYALTDIYALGLLIWETLYYIHHGQSILCKEAIMPGVEENGDVLERIAGGKFVPPCDFLSKEVGDFLGTCWHFDPMRRFQSIELMMEKWAKMLEPLMISLPSDALEYSSRSSGGAHSSTGSNRPFFGKQVKFSNAASSSQVSISIMSTTSVSTGP